MDARNVYPESEDFQALPSDCLRELGWIGGEWDYNCDHSTENQYGTVFESADCSLSDGECTFSPGWDADKVKCGGKARWIRHQGCVIGGEGCLSITNTLPAITTVRCR